MRMRVCVVRVLVWLLLVLASAPGGTAQTATTTTPDQLVRLWFERWNALGSGPGAIDELLSLYEPAALHITGPSADQRGTATYRGAEGLRVLATTVAASREKMTYRIDTETAREETATLFHRTDGPWGGSAVAVQFVAVFTERTTQKRYTQPGAAFFQLAGGKIHRARIYYAEGEKTEVEPEARRRPG